MRRTVKHAQKANFWFFVLTWFTSLWALVGFFVCWPKISWSCIRTSVLLLLCTALLLSMTAFFQRRLRCLNKRQRVHLLIVVKQRQAMALFLLSEAGIIAFITLITQALTL